MSHEISLDHDGPTTQASIFPAQNPSHVLVFAAGSGGQPGRHAGLLQALAGHGLTVVAPHFERLTGPFPSETDLLRRTAVLRACVDHAAALQAPVVAAGHSIGATVLLALAGAQLWMSTGKRLQVEPDPRIGRIVMLAPPTDFFRGPFALDAVQISVQLWAGLQDNITPPGQARFLAETLPARAAVDARYVDGAGHFSFMNELPPTVSDTLPDRPGFLGRLASDMATFLRSQAPA